MNRQEYLRDLERALRDARVADCDEIMDEYNEHFELKLRDGYSEEEIAAKLAPPKELAGQFEAGMGTGERKVVKAIVTTGLVFCDIFVGSFFILLYSWCVVLGALVVSFGLGGLGVMFRSVFPPEFLRTILQVPNMPPVCALLLGISLIAAAVLSVIGTMYCLKYTNQLLRVYIRWHRAVQGGTASVSPPMPKYPSIDAKKRRMMRTVALAALVVFAVFFLTGFVSMIIAARSFEPWHVWGWFIA